MSKVTVFVGLDYHKDSIQVCVVDRDGEVPGNRRVLNDVIAVMRFAESLGDVRRAAVESCPGAADVAEELVQNGWHVELAHPGFVSRMKQNPDKTDFSDARMLVDLTRVGYLPRVWLAPQSVRELRRLVRYRQQQVNERRSVKLRITAHAWRVYCGPDLVFGAEGQIGAEETINPRLRCCGISGLPNQITSTAGRRAGCTGWPRAGSCRPKAAGSSISTCGIWPRWLRTSTP